MDAFLTAILLMSASIAVGGWYAEHSRAEKLAKDWKDCDTALMAANVERNNKELEIQRLKVDLLKAERYVPKTAGDVVRARNWRQVLAENERARSETEYEEELKRDNTKLR